MLDGDFCCHDCWSDPIINSSYRQLKVCAWSVRDVIALSNPSLAGGRQAKMHVPRFFDYGSMYGLLKKGGFRSPSLRMTDFL